jgi:hypothetical protein
MVKNRDAPRGDGPTRLLGAIGLKAVRVVTTARIVAKIRETTSVGTRTAHPRPVTAGIRVTSGIGGVQMVNGGITDATSVTTGRAARNAVVTSAPTRNVAEIGQTDGPMVTAVTTGATPVTTVQAG